MQRWKDRIVEAVGKCWVTLIDAETNDDGKNAVISCNAQFCEPLIGRSRYRVEKDIAGSLCPITGSVPFHHGGKFLGFSNRRVDKDIRESRMNTNGL
jgi:hypothetical protein